MHYVFILSVLMAICFATGGQRDRFTNAWKAAAVGDLEAALDEAADGVRLTFREAEPRLLPTNASRKPAPGG